MNHIRVHRLFWHLHQRIHRHMKVFRNFMKFNRVDCSCTIHDFAHCLLGDSNSFCQINLLFVFFFQFSLNVVCNYHIYIQHIIASYSCTYIIRSLAKNINHLETIFEFHNNLFPFRLQNKSGGSFYGTTTLHCIGFLIFPASFLLLLLLGLTFLFSLFQFDVQAVKD